MSTTTQQDKSNTGKGTREAPTTVARNRGIDATTGILGIIRELPEGAGSRVHGAISQLRDNEERSAIRKCLEFLEPLNDEKAAAVLDGVSKTLSAGRTMKAGGH